MNFLGIFFFFYLLSLFLCCCVQPGNEHNGNSNNNSIRKLFRHQQLNFIAESLRYLLLFFESEKKTFRFYSFPVHFFFRQRSFALNGTLSMKMKEKQITDSLGYESSNYYYYSLRTLT